MREIFCFDCHQSWLCLLFAAKKELVGSFETSALMYQIVQRHNSSSINLSICQSLSQSVSLSVTHSKHRTSSYGLISKHIGPSTTALLSFYRVGLTAVLFSGCLHLMWLISSADGKLSLEAIFTIETVPVSIPTDRFVFYKAWGQAYRLTAADCIGKECPYSYSQPINQSPVCGIPWLARSVNKAMSNSQSHTCRILYKRTLIIKHCRPSCGIRDTHDSFLTHHLFH